MGLLDDLLDKAGDLGDKAKEGLGTATDKASDLIDDVKDKFDGDEEATPTDKVEEAVNYSPGTAEDASSGTEKPWRTPPGPLRSPRRPRTPSIRRLAPTPRI